MSTGKSQGEEVSTMETGTGESANTSGANSTQYTKQIEKAMSAQKVLLKSIDTLLNQSASLITKFEAIGEATDKTKDEIDAIMELLKGLIDKIGEGSNAINVESVDLTKAKETLEEAQDAAQNPKPPAGQPPGPEGKSGGNRYRKKRKTKRKNLKGGTYPKRKRKRKTMKGSNNSEIFPDMIK